MSNSAFASGERRHLADPERCPIHDTTLTYSDNYCPDCDDERQDT